MSSHKKESPVSENSETQTFSENPSNARPPAPDKRRRLYIIGAVVCGVVTAIIIAVIILLSIGGTTKKHCSHSKLVKNASSKYHWKGCGNLGKCNLKGFEKPPLVLLSLDGFAEEYLKRNLVPSLKYFSECGAKGSKVYPSYPSKTFPNHYTMVTGLFPESHGIVDNNIFDKKLSTTLQSMKTTNISGFYQGDPIWSVYQRVTGKKANGIFWPGGFYNASGYPPSEMITPYDNKLTLRKRIDKALEWLQLPSEERPGLINIYFHQPDAAGHVQKSPEDVNEQLRKIDDDLDYMMSKLSESGLLECINFGIVSDHGMQIVDKYYYMQDYIPNSDGLIYANGVIGRIYIRDTNKKTEKEVADQIRCKIPDVKVNTKKDMPVRKHYSKNDRVGDFVLEGKYGSKFFVTPNEFKGTGDHGYDYLNEKMQSIFFIRGPSIKANVEISPFQNVEFMNLWLNLLGIDEREVETNGTVGFFDNILVNPPKREMMKNVVGECAAVGPAKALKCAGDADLASLTSKLESSSSLDTKFTLLYSDEHCLQRYFNNVDIIKSKNQEDHSVAIIEVLSKDDPVKDSNSSFINAKYQDKCPVFAGSGIKIAAGRNEMSNIADSFFDFPASFQSKVLKTLRDSTTDYLTLFGKVFVISGTAMDENYDGIADKSGSIPTHFYRILLTCKTEWVSVNPPVCKNLEDFKTLSFIFPITDEETAMDCMTSQEIFLDYTATIFDVEQIAGFKFQIDGLTQHENAVLRRRIATNLS